MRLIITGGLGHIGTGILSKIQIFDIFKEIIVIDKSVREKINHIFNYKSRFKVKILDENIIDFKLEKILKKNDIVIHLAAITNATESFFNKKKIFQNNFLSTKKVVEACKKKSSKCIFVSTTSIYGSKDKIMYEDNLKNIRPQSPYASCKLKEEKYILKSFKSKKYKDKFIILRLGTIFGVSSGMRFHTVVNKFCYQATLNKPLTIWKTAYHQRRPYLDLNDAINCFSFIIKNNKFNNQICNVVTNNLSIKELVKKIRKFKKINIRFVNSKIMNQLSYDVSCKKILSYGFIFRGNLEKQIKSTFKIIKGT